MVPEVHINIDITTKIRINVSSIKLIIHLIMPLYYSSFSLKLLDEKST